MQDAIALPSVLTAATVVSVREQLLRQLQVQPRGAALVLDASAVQSFDSAGMALLLACRRAAQQRQQVLTVQGWTSGLRSLAQVYGVLPLLDRDAAAAGLSALE